MVRAESRLGVLRSLGGRAAANDLVAGSGRYVDPRIGLIVALSRSGA